MKIFCPTNACDQVFHWQQPLIVKKHLRQGLRCKKCNNVFFPSKIHKIQTLNSKRNVIYLKRISDFVYRNDYLLVMYMEDWLLYNKTNKRIGDIEYSKKIKRPIFYNEEQIKFKPILRRKDVFPIHDEKIINFYLKKGKLPSTWDI